MIAFFALIFVLAAAITIGIIFWKDINKVFAIIIAVVISIVTIILDGIAVYFIGSQLLFFVRKNLEARRIQDKPMKAQQKLAIICIMILVFLILSVLLIAIVTINTYVFNDNTIDFSSKTYKLSKAQKVLQSIIVLELTLILFFFNSLIISVFYSLSLKNKKK